MSREGWGLYWTPFHLYRKFVSKWWTSMNYSMLCLFVLCNFRTYIEFVSYRAILCDMKFYSITCPSDRGTFPTHLVGNVLWIPTSYEPHARCAFPSKLDGIGIPVKCLYSSARFLYNIFSFSPSLPSGRRCCVSPRPTWFVTRLLRTSFKRNDRPGRRHQLWLRVSLS